VTESAERTAVRRALDGLKPYLVAFVSQNGGPVRSPTSPDTATLLKALLDGWDRQYAAHLPHVARSYVHELLDVRNRWAHEQPFSSAEASRAVDTVRQLAAVIGAPTSEVQSSATVPRGRSAATINWSGQRAVMRDIYTRFRGDESRIIAEYAAAERSGRVQRKGQRSGHTPEAYAKALLADGLNKRWLR